MKKRIRNLLLVVLGMTLVTGCGSNSKKTEDTPIENPEKATLNVQVKDDMFYVNDHMVDLYEECSNDNISEEEFYNSEEIKYNYEIVGDIVYLELKSQECLARVFIDSDGHIIERLENMDLSLSTDKEDPNSLVTYEVSKVEGNSIYLKVRRFYESAACTDVLNNNEDAIYSTIDKITYLDDGTFKIEKGISDTMTSGEYVSDMGGLDACVDNPNIK